MEEQFFNVIQQIIQSNHDLNLILAQIADNTKSTWALNWNSISSIATGASAIGTLVLAWLTKNMVKEMKEARISEYRPYVVAYLEFKEHTVHFVCKNIGKSAAKEVQVSFDKNFIGMDHYNIKEEIFNTPIPSMPPEYEIKTFVNSSIDILREYPNSCKHYFINATIEYEDDHNQSYRDVYKLDLGGQSNIRFINGTDTRIEEHLDDIATDLHSISEILVPVRPLEGMEAIHAMQEMQQRD